MRLPFIALFLLFATNSLAQNSAGFADSIRKEYRIPELSYAVVSADSIYELQALGIKKIGTDVIATVDDRFSIGSNTKAITAFIAAQLVQEQKISWYTKFFDLFPEMKNDSNSPYQDLTLIELLTFRTNLIPYTYTNEIPTQDQFVGNEDTQRYQFAKWFFNQPPVANPDASIIFSNLDYVAAGLMLERASGKSYSLLVNELGSSLDISFGFGRPNLYDPRQTWGHDEHLKPEAPAGNYRLNLLQAAGNINVNLPDYIKFLQLQLKGLEGRSDVLPQKTFELLHYGLPKFSIGWFWEGDSTNGRFSYNEGNPGTFLSKVYVFKELDKAFVIFSNVQSDHAQEGMDVLFDHLLEEYGR